MTTSLHDRLADLAADAPPGGPAPDLWERGRRYHRRRRAGTLAIAAAACLALVVITGLSWQRSAPVPAPARGPVGLPDRVWTPSPWLPTVDRPGQLVAVSVAAKGTWTGTQTTAVGISATSGEYSFLELPDANQGTGRFELAPDGRHLAYWLTGPTTDTPNSDSGPVTGVAVYDTTTGDVTRHWIATAHGLEPDFLTWADAGTVVFSAGQIRGGDDDSLMDQSSSSFGMVTAWPLGGEPAALPGVERGAELQGAGHGWILVGTSSHRSGREHLLVDVAKPRRARYIDVPEFLGSTGFLHFVAVDAAGRRIALVPGNRTPNQVKAGPISDLSAVRGTERTLGVVDWIGDDTIVTLGFADRRWDRSGLYRVSVATGESHEIVRFPTVTGVGSWQVATDLLDAPSVHAGRPPSPIDPRVAAGLSVAVVVGGLLALVLWRRRVRA